METKVIMLLVGVALSGLMIPEVLTVISLGKVRSNSHLPNLVFAAAAFCITYYLVG